MTADATGQGFREKEDELVLQHVSTSEALGEFITEHKKRRKKQGQDNNNMLILDPDFHDYAISFTDKVSSHLLGT